MYSRSQIMNWIHTQQYTVITIKSEAEAVNWNQKSIQITQKIVK